MNLTGFANRLAVGTLDRDVSAYDTTKSNAATGALLLAVSNVSIGFGVNLLTNPQGSRAGEASLVIGAALVVAGIYFSFFKDKR